MIQYNSLNVKLSNSELNKLKSAIKNETDAVLRLSSNMIGNSDDEISFPHKLLLTDRQVANLRKALTTHQLVLNCQKQDYLRLIQYGGFLGRLLGPLLKTGLPLLKSVIKPLGLLDLTVASSVTDAGVQK